MGDTYLGGGSDSLGGGEGTTGCPEDFETWYGYRWVSDGASKRLVDGRNKPVDNRMTERSWEDESRQEEHGAIPSVNFSHPAQLKCMQSRKTA
jgi:hypothetical protein